MNEFTGERVIPGQVEVDLWNEHVARYAFASRFATGRRVLDAGCGTGYGSAELSRNARAVTALDISEEAVRYTRCNFPVENLAVVAGSASSLPFGANAFDLIVAFEVIEHLPDWSCLIAEAGRVLTPDGLLLVSTPNKDYYSASRGTAGENPFHVHEFTAAEFESELKRTFAHVRLFLQNRSEAFVFYPHRTSPPAEARIETTAGHPGNAHFFLAICSWQPIDPPPFVFVPRSANVLFEREQHIAKLRNELDLNRQWLDETRAAQATLLAAHETQREHLEEQNRWARDLEQKWHEAQARIVELQDAYAAEQSAATRAIESLEDENARKTDWAHQLSAEIVQLKQSIDEINATLDERTRWAQQLDSSLADAERRLNLVRASRWTRTGRLFGLGPEV